MILSDIHGNWDALTAVLEDAEGHYDEILCCGDLVGYGGAPREVLRWAKESLALVVRGNHDRACCGLDDLDWFNDHAREAALWTAQEIGPEGREYLHALPQGPLVRDDYALVHGSPEDEDEYLVSDADTFGLDRQLMRPLTFFGHTHLQGGWVWSRGGPTRLPRPGTADKEVLVSLALDCLYLVNPGSVGQPRDQDPRAAYACYNPHLRQVRLRRAAYDVGKAQDRIRQAGLPELLAKRLALGR